MNARYAIFDRDAPPMSSTHFSVDFIVDLIGTVFDIEPEGQGDGTAFAKIFSKFAIEQGEVFFLGVSILKLFREVTVRFLGKGEYEESRGVHVETVDGGLFNASRNGGADPVGDRINFFGATSWH
jgi:hypothetical protein